MITEIKLNSVASYKEETVISNLKKVNFFFGSNGTGKSTIGKYLHAFKIAEDKENVKDFEQCSIQGYNSDGHELLVFNQQFIETNFIRYNEMPGIFTLDETNDIIEKEIEKEQDKIEKWQKCLDKLQEKRDELENSKKEFYSGANGVIEKSWSLRNDFNKNFKKMPPLEHLKSKENHYQKIVTILETYENKNIEYQDLIFEYRKLYEKEISKIEQSFNNFLYRDIRKIEIEINNKLALPFTGNKDVNIANMIESLSIQNWVEERYNKLDKSLLSQKCPFCQEETIKQDLIKQFEDYFDRTFTEKKEAIQKLKKQYNEHYKLFIKHLRDIETNYPFKSDLSQLINKLERFFEKQEKVIQDKIDNTNKELSISSVKSNLQDLKTVKKNIASNNEDFEKLDEKRKELIQNIWNYMSFHAREFIDIYGKEKIQLDKKLSQINDISDYKNTQIFKSEAIIEEKRKHTSNTETARKEINKILKSTGFHGFSIGRKDNTENNVPRYYLKRTDENKTDVFSSLSEGEKNFIAFLYFYWLCKGTDNQKRKNGKKKIIVIDDPVSSLDSQALFVVTTIIRDLAKKKGNDKNSFIRGNIIQLFVFSHNLYFYNEVSYNTAYKHICQSIHHYQISKPSGKTLISVGSDKNNIENDYNLMWRGLFELKKQGETFNVVIGNLMRRIIQSYLQFTHSHTKERLLYENLEDNTKKMLYDAFSSQINKESHHVNPLEEMSFQRIAGFNELKNEILFDVFEMYFKDIGAENHYNAMKNYVDN